MQNFQRFAVTVAFSFTCFSVPVLGAQKVESGVGAEKVALGSSKPGVGLTSGRVVPGDITVLPIETTGTGEEPGGVRPGGGSTGVERAIELPTKPDWVGSLADQVQALREQFKKEHTDLLKAYQEVLKQAKEVGKEERDKVREQFKVQRDEMIARQKELREELKRRFQEFRAEHPEHLEVIDAAKERAKEAVRERRGHGGE